MPRLVRDLHDRRAGVAVHGPKEFEHGPGIFRITVGARLVRKDDRGPVHESLGNAGPLLLSDLLEYNLHRIPITRTM